MATAYLEHTLAAAGTNGNKKATFSAWLKRAKTGVEHVFYTVRQDSNNFFRFRFNDDDTLNVTSNTSGTNYYATADGKYRDTNAWYHVVIAYDTTQATEANRIRIYVNGVEKGKSASNYPSQDATLFMIASGQPQRVGQESGGGYYDGLMAHVHYTEGYAYAATDFGETDSTSGIWVPKTSPSVTYGTNGFFLKFDNSGAMGTDSSGNSNTYTVNGTMTQNTDTPTNNACTLNGVSNEASGFTLANGNLSATYSSGDWETIQGTLGVNKGKWYYETKWNGSGAYMAGWTSVNFMNASPVNYVGHTHTEPSYAIQASDGGIYYSTSSAATQDSASWGDTFGSSNVLGCAIDIDNGKLYWSKDGVWMNSGVPTSGSTGTGAFSISDTATNYFWNPVMSSYNGAQGMFNFGSGFFGTTAVSSANADANGHGAFEYAVPSGYYALNTKNLKEFG